MVRRLAITLEAHSLVGSRLIFIIFINLPYCGYDHGGDRLEQLLRIQKFLAKG